jgi:hypothetical protein
MSEHTKEPWRCSNRNWRDEEHPFHWFVTGGHAEEDGGGEYSVAVAVVVGNETAGDIPRDTARRICAAVNGTAGIPTDALEAGVVANLRDRLAAAESQVERLKEACREVACDLLYYADTLEGFRMPMWSSNCLVSRRKLLAALKPIKEQS